MKASTTPVVYVALAVTHFLWAVSLLLDPAQYAGKPVSPMLFAIFHIIAAVMIVVPQLRVYGGGLSATILSYYLLMVKPRAPIAEPQSVGILAISLVLLLPALEAVMKRKVAESVSLFLFRLGLAYPFLEWGLDALRNPLHFVAYLTYENPLTSHLALGNPFIAVAALGWFEVALSVVMALGMLTRLGAKISLAALLVFGVVAAYPLALPQDIGLAATAYLLIREGAGSYSVDALVGWV